MQKLFGTVAVFTLLAACGGSAARVESSGLAETKQLSALTSTEIAALCSWAADYLGGDGVTVSCNGEAVAKANTAGCIQHLGAGHKQTGCTATVSDFEGVFKALAACEQEAPSGLAAVQACIP